MHPQESPFEPFVAPVTSECEPAGIEELRGAVLDLPTKLRSRPLSPIPPSNIVTPDQLRERFGAGTICVCDFYVAGIEHGAEHPYGFERDGIINIDHHAPVTRFARSISSGNLACRYVEEHGPLPAQIPVVINHLDTDSFVSALVMTGALPPAKPLEDLVIGADHLGSSSRIVDLLQSLAKTQELAFAAECFKGLILGEELAPRALDIIATRAADRARGSEYLNSGVLRVRDQLAWAITDKPLESDLVLPLVPEAVMIILFSKHPEVEGNWVVKTRLGRAAHAGLTLFDININQIDPIWGGRWNAGSNERGGGTPIPPTAYLEEIRQRLCRVLAQ